MERRFGDEATIEYFDVDVPAIRSEHAKVIEEIETRGLLYPVTVIADVPVYDGAVSYPAILRQVSEQLARAEA